MFIRPCNISQKTLHWQTRQSQAHSSPRSAPRNYSSASSPRRSRFTEKQFYGCKVLFPGEQGPNSAVIADLVLVHGLTDDYLNTWTTSPHSDKPNYCWPRDLLPQLRQDIRIMTYSYDANVANFLQPAGADGLLDHAENFLTHLSLHRKDPDAHSRPLIFIGHSLGGLVIEQALLASSRNSDPCFAQIFNSTVGIFTMGTPHYGSQLAGPAVLFARIMSPFHHFNVGILGVLQVVRETLHSWQEDFVRLLQSRQLGSKIGGPIFVFCGYEDVPIPWLGKIVSSRSAVLKGDSKCIKRCSIHGNHIDIVKFSDPEDDGFAIIWGYLFELLEKLPSRHADTYTIVAEESISERSAHRPVEPLWRIKKLPHIAKRFIGRGELLDHVAHKFSSRKKDEPAVIVLLGQGGQGKSQTALEYARQAYLRRDYEWVIWVDACSENTTRLGFLAICDELDRTSVNLDDFAKVRKAIRLLAKATYKWLLVLDNYDRMGAFNVSEFFPKSQVGHIIITSRDSATEVYGTPVLVMVMSDADALEMLRSRYKTYVPLMTGWDETAAIELLKELGNLPLAIEQAAAYLSSSQRSMSCFLSFYRKNRTEVLRFVPENMDYREDSRFDGSSWGKGRSLSVLTTWEMSFKAIQDLRETAANKPQHIGQYAAEILQITAFLDRTNISLAFLAGLIDSGRGRLRLDWVRKKAKEKHLLLAVKLLDAWFLIESLRKVENEYESFSLHPLVQEWVRHRLSRMERQAFILKAIQLIEKHLERDHDDLISSPLEEKRQILMHLDAIIQEFEGESLSYPSGPTHFQLGHGALALTAIRFASFYHDMGYVNRAGKLYERVLHFHGGEQKRKGLRALEALEGLALVRLWQEKPEEAYTLCKEALDGNLELFGENHLVTLRTTHNLGEIECLRKNFDEAIRIFEISLAGFERHCGSRSKETLRQKEALGNSYRAKGDYEQAHPLVYEAMTKLKALDSTSDLTLNATESLALVKKGQGQLDEAVALYKTVIEGYKRTVGIQQFGTLGAMAGLADTYRKLGLFKEAAALFKEIMTHREHEYSVDSEGYLRAKVAYDNVTSDNPDAGTEDDFSYPWPRPVYAYELSSPFS